MSELKWALVCTPEDPVVAAWSAAAAAMGVAAPRVVAWDEVLSGTAVFGAGELVHAERLTPEVPARFGGSRARYERFAAALTTLRDRLAAAAATATVETDAVLLALDRKRCAEHLAAAGVPVPTPGSRFVRQRFSEPGDVITYMNINIMTQLRLVRTRSGFELRHSLHTQYYRAAHGENPVDETNLVHDLIAREEETVAVADLPTAYLNDAQHRFRFAVIDGQVTHAAGTLADTRLAREYYGGRRREIDAYHVRFGAEAWQRLIDLAVRAAAALPGLPAVGVDIAASQTGGADLVYDIDPFGARLPAALGRPGTVGEGLDVPATMLRHWMTR